MQRILPETDLEKKLMCLGAIFVEENAVLDELFQLIGSDLVEQKELSPEKREQVLEEIGEYFFRLDMNYGPEIRGDCVAILEDYWQVRSQEEVQKTLENIRNQGHRTKFNVLASALPKEGTLQVSALAKFKQIFQFDLEESQQLSMSDEDYLKLAQWVQRSQKYLNDAGILAWDVARYIHLVKLSFIAHYLDDNQAWAEVLKIAPLIEGRFESWMGYSQSFLIGRTFWLGIDDPKMKEICERLLGHPASPWNFIGWT